MDSESFKAIFLPYYQKLYRVAFRIIGDCDNAEDMVQEAYIKLWNKRDDMYYVENFEAFAVVTLKNTCLDFLRKQKNKFQTDNTTIAETKSLSKEIDQKDSVEYVKILIEKLPEQQRLLMIYKHWDGYSDKEIEDITGLSAVNIRVILSRARKTICQQFEKTDKKSLYRDEN